MYHTSCTMLPDSVSHACTTIGELTCSFHLPSDLLPEGGAVGKAKAAAGSACLSALGFACSAALSLTCTNSQYPDAMRKPANGMLSQNDLLVPAQTRHACTTPHRSAHAADQAEAHLTKPRRSTSIGIRLLLADLAKLAEFEDCLRHSVSCAKSAMDLAADLSAQGVIWFPYVPTTDADTR